MSDLNAAATLSMKIDTGSAAAELVALREAYALLKKDLATGLQAVGGASSLTAELTKAKATIQEMDRALKTSAAAQDALEKKFKEAQSTYRQAADQANYLLSVQLKSAEMTGNAAVKAANDVARAKNQANSLELKVIKQEELQAVREAERAAKELARAKNLANSLELKVISAEEAAKVKDAERAAKELARAKNLANSLELRVIAAEEAAKIKDAERAAKELARAKNLANSLELRVIAAEEATKIKEAERAAKELARAKNMANSLELRVIAAEEAGKVKEAEKAMKELARAKNLANSLELRVIAAEEATKVKEAERSARELARAKDAANRLELRVISAEQAAAIKAAKKDAEDIAKWMAMTNKQQAAASLKAAKAMYSGADPRMLPGMAGSNQAIAYAQQLGSIQAAQAAFDALGGSTGRAADHQIHWNKAAGEAHALARGLSGSLGTLWITYGSLLPLLAGAAMGSGFVQAAKQGAEFAYQLTFVKALSNETADSMWGLNKAALEMSRTGLYAPTEIASGFRILAQAGLSATDAVKAMPDVLNLATVGEMNMEQAATTLVGVMNAFNLTIDQSQHVGDVFAKAAALSQTSVQSMTEAMKYASVVGEQYGANIEDTATAVTLLAKVNITGTSAGTAFRNMLKELYSPTKQAGDAIKALGLQTSDAQGNLKPFVDIIYDLKGKLEDYNKADQVTILQKIFGERGAKEAIAMLALTRDEWDKLRSSIADSEGFMGGVADELENTAQGKWKQALNTLKANLVETFQAMEPEFINLADQFRILFANPEFSEGLLKIVKGMTTLTLNVVEMAPKIMTLVEIFAVAKVGMGTYSLAVATAGASLTAIAGPLGIVAGLLTGGAVAWTLWGDNGKAAIEQVGKAAETATAQMESLLQQQQLGYGVNAKSWDVSGTQLLRSRSGVEKSIQSELAGAKENLGLDYSFEGGQFYDKNRNIITHKILQAEGWTADLKKLYKTYGDLTDNIQLANSNMKEALAAEGEVERKMAAAKKPVTKKWDGTDKAGGRLPKDWDYEAEKMAIARVTELQKREIDVLESAHSNKLISEEQYQRDLAGLYDKYEPTIEALYKQGLDRLKGLTQSANEEEAKRAEAHYQQLANDQEKHENATIVRKQKAIDREKGLVVAAEKEMQQAIAKAKATSQEYIDRLADTRAKASMSPEQAAAYDAENKIKAAYRDPITKFETDAKNYKDSYGEDDIYKAKIKRIEDLTEARRNDINVARQAASDEAQYARSFEAGWKNAYNTYVNDATNSATAAQQMFNLTVGKMDSVLEEFITKGTVDWQKLGTSIITELIKIEARWLISRMFNPDRAGNIGPGGSMLKMLIGGEGDKGETGNPVQDAAAGNVNTLAAAASAAAEKLYGLAGLSDYTQGSVAGLGQTSAKASSGLNAVETSGTEASGALTKTADNAYDAAAYLMRMATSPMGGVAAGMAGGTGGSGLWGLAAGMIANYFVPGSGAMVSGLVNAGVGAYNGNTAQAIQGLAGAVAGYGSMTATTQTAAQQAVAKDVNSAGLGGYAKGGTFGSGALHAFAKGGAFSNEVLTSPTFFKFANGGQFNMAVAGEAGPEAVMPLGRDSQGRLGVINQNVQAAQAPAAPQEAPQNNIRIVNAFDTGVIGDYLGSSDGEKIIMNAVKRNPSMIKTMARA